MEVFIARAIRHRRGTKYHPVGRTHWLEQDIREDDHQVEQDPHLDELKGSNSTAIAHSIGIRPVASKGYHHESPAVSRTESFSGNPLIARAQERGGE